MNQEKAKPTKPLAVLEELDDFIYYSMLQLGWVANTNQESLTQGDELLQKEDFSLPTALQSFSPIRKKIEAGRRASESEKNESSSETDKPLSRAARFGTPLSEATEQKMKKDKRHSQQQNKSDYDDLFD